MRLAIDNGHALLLALFTCPAALAFEHALATLFCVAWAICVAVPARASRLHTQRNRMFVLQVPAPDASGMPADVPLLAMRAHKHVGVAACLELCLPRQREEVVDIGAVLHARIH